MAHEHDILPESLTPGTVLVAKRGNKVSLVGSSKKDEYGSRKFRLKYHPYVRDGWRMPGVTGKDYYTRDDLQEMELRLV